MTGVIFSQALRDSLRFRRVFPWLVLGVLCYSMAAYWPHLIHGATKEETYVSVASILVFRILALASAIFTTSIVSQEVEGRTIVYLLTRPVPRWKLLLARFAASVVVVSLLGAFGLVLTSIASFGSVHNPLLFHDLVAIVLGAIAYGALFLQISLMVNRAMVYCLLFAFGWETAIPNLSGDLYHLSIYSYIQGVSQHPSSSTSKLIDFMSGGSGGSISPLSAYLSLSIFALGILLLAAWWFTHFEYVPREDAE